MKSRGKVWLIVSFCILTMAVVPAASSQAAAQAAGREFIYTANFADNTVSGFSLDPVNGKAAEVPGSPFGAGVGPASITHSPDGRFVYAVMSSQFQGRPCGINNGELISYSVNPRTGVLTLLDDVILSGVCSTGVAVDPGGKFVYAASFPLDGPKVGIIDGFQTSNGHLLPLPGTPFASPLEVAGGQNPALQTLAIPPDGKALYASNPNDSRGILIFDRDTTTGALEFRTGVETGSPFAPMAIAPSGRFLIAMGEIFFGASEPGVFEFEIGRHGGLTPVPGSPFSIPGGGFGFALAVSPRSNFVDVTGTGGIFVFRENNRGRLSLAPGSPFGGSTPVALAFDPDGRFLVAPGTVFRSNPGTGALTRVSDFTPGGGVDGLTVLRTCGVSAEDRGDKRGGPDKHGAEGKHESGCHERDGVRDRD